MAFLVRLTGNYCSDSTNEDLVNSPLEMVQIEDLSGTCVQKFVYYAPIFKQFR